jgi:hypothetical protein
MRPPATLRKWQFDQLRLHVKVMRFIVGGAGAEELTRAREKPDGWTAAEVLGHLLDCERLFLQRARMTMEQESPLLPFPDQDEEVRKGGYNERDPSAVLGEWERTREEYLEYLAAVPDGSWGREGRHPTYDPFSLTDQLALACRHTLLHLEQITRILSVTRGAR